MIKRLMSKKANLFGKQIPVFVIALIAVIGFASATVYVVNSLTLHVGVAEAFTVEYAVLGDGGTYHYTDWNTAMADCGQALWFNSEQNVPTGNMRVGEGRFVCVKITNLAESAIPYVIATNVTKGGVANETCTAAFAHVPITGTALAGTSTGPTDTITGALVQPAFNAAPVSDCDVTITVGRGTVST
jgi:hypothetical protein